MHPIINNIVVFKYAMPRLFLQSKVATLGMKFKPPIMPTYQQTDPFLERTGLDWPI